MPMAQHAAAGCSPSRSACTFRTCIRKPPSLHSARATTLLYIIPDLPGIDGQPGRLLNACLEGALCRLQTSPSQLSCYHVEPCHPWQPRVALLLDKVSKDASKGTAGSQADLEPEPGSGSWTSES